MIIRTAGEGKLRRYFIRDLALLLEEWKNVQDKITGGPPACVFQEPDLIERTVRDFTEDVSRIVIDDHRQYARAELIGRISQRSREEDRVLQRAQNPLRPIQHFPPVGASLRTPGHAQERRLPDHRRTEALVAIDVNTGRHKGLPGPRPEPCSRLTLEAGRRNLPPTPAAQHGRHHRPRLHRHEVPEGPADALSADEENLRRDRAKTHILPLSQLGLMEMTQQRHTRVRRRRDADRLSATAAAAVSSRVRSMSVEIQRKLTAIMKAVPATRAISSCASTAIRRSWNVSAPRTKLLIELEKKFTPNWHFRPEAGFHNEQWRIQDAIKSGTRPQRDLNSSAARALWECGSGATAFHPAGRALKELKPDPRPLRPSQIGSAAAA